MRPAIAAAVAGLPLVPSVASACQCILPRDPDARREVIIARHTYVFSGRVISVRKRPPLSPDLPEPTIEARVEVLRQFKGTLPAKVVVISYGGVNGENCGAGEGLALAWANERPFSFAVAGCRTKTRPPSGPTAAARAALIFPVEPEPPAAQ